MPRIWNKRIHKNIPRDAVNCMRPGPYSNPFIIGKHGDRKDVCEKFERETLPTLNVEPLRGKDLVCCCKPLQCHCDSIFKKLYGTGSLLDA